MDYIRLYYLWIRLIDFNCVEIMLDVVVITTCDQAWENRFYVHVKFNLILRV